MVTRNPFAFYTDLRKLIKYEEHLGVNLNQGDHFDKLFRKTTASFRAKIDKENGKEIGIQVQNKNKQLSTVALGNMKSDWDGGKIANSTRSKSSGSALNEKQSNLNIAKNAIERKKPTSNLSTENNSKERKQCTPNVLYSQKPKNIPETSRKFNDRPKSAQEMRDLLLSDEKTTMQIDDKDAGSKQRLSRTPSRTSSTGDNRRRSKTPRCRYKDPVQLYQYYSREWKRFKNRLPGENDHSDLRWLIRCKLLKNSNPCRE